MNDKALTPLEQKTVVFYEDELTAVLVNDKRGVTVYVPIRPMCEFMGLNWDGQRRRTLRDAVLKDEVKGVVVTTTPSEGGRGGGPQEMTCLPLKFIPGWLFGISADRVSPDLRDKIVRYQRECYEVLAEAFREGRLTADPSFTELLRTETPAVQAYKTALAIVEIARQQVIMEARLYNHEQRLEWIEAQLGDQSRTITEEQAVQISQAVKAIGMVWSKQEKKNQYGAVYGRFYQQFEITSYKLLPSRRFKEAMSWLTSWYVELAGSSEVPF